MAARPTARASLIRPCRPLRLSQQIIGLQWKELQYLHTNNQNLATTSAVLVSFGFIRAGTSNSLTNLYGPTDNIFSGTVDFTKWQVLACVMEGLIGTTLSLAISFNLICLFTSTVCMMTGPGLALRGPEGSVGRAVKHMEKQNQRSLRFFGRGLTAFCLHLVFLSFRSWFGLSFIDGFTGLLIGLYTVRTLFRYGSDIGERFYVSPTQLVRGTFKVGEEDGKQIWVHTPDEMERGKGLTSRCADRMWGTISGHSGWKAPGHNRLTPLWRLDKLIAFPWTERDEMEGRASGRERRGSVGGHADARDPDSPFRQSTNEREQVDGLLRRMQGPDQTSAHRGGAAGGGGAGYEMGPTGAGGAGGAPMSAADAPDILDRLAAGIDFKGSFASFVMGGDADGTAKRRPRQESAPAPRRAGGKDPLLGGAQGSSEGDGRGPGWWNIFGGEERRSAGRGVPPSISEAGPAGRASKEVGWDPAMTPTDIEAGGGAGATAPAVASAAPAAAAAAAAAPVSEHRFSSEWQVQEDGSMVRSPRVTSPPPGQGGSDGGATVIERAGPAPPSSPPRSAAQGPSTVPSTPGSSDPSRMHTPASARESVREASGGDGGSSSIRSHRVSRV